MLSEKEKKTRKIVKPISKKKNRFVFGDLIYVPCMKGNILRHKMVENTEAKWRNVLTRCADKSLQLVFILMDFNWSCGH